MRDIALRKCAHLTMALIAALAGCGGGGGGDGANSPSPPAPTGPIDVTVTVIDPSSATGYAAAAAVCLDQDASQTCDAAELAGVTGADGKLRLTVAVADQPRLSGGQWLARLTTSFSGTAGNTVTAEVLQVARAGGATQTQVVVSPLTTWIEQLVLATMNRADAVAAVRELAGLAALDPAADFVAAAAGPQAAEAQGARNSARGALANQTPELMAVFKAPAPEYPQALLGTGVHRIRLEPSGFGGGDYEGALNSSRLVRPAGAAASQVELVSRAFRRDSGQWDVPVPIAQDGPLPGPVLNADGRWTTAIPEVGRVVEGGRTYLTHDGQRRWVEVRNAVSVEGQEIDLSHFINAGGDPPTPGGQRFPVGSLHFKHVASVNLTSFGVADALFERLDQNDRPLPGPAQFPSYEDFVAQYPTAGGVWFKLPQGFFEQIAFDAGGAPHFRAVDPFDPNSPVDHGPGRVTTLQFAGATIHRIHVPEAAQLNVGDTIDLVVAAGGLRPIYISQRGTISAGPTRAFNATAAEAMLAHVLWPVPPGGL